jgi:hypothetical protein
MAQGTRLRSLADATLSGLGLIGASDLRVVGRTSTSTPYAYWSQRAGEFFHTSVATALGLCQGGRNEVVLVTPESHAQAAALTWSKSLTHLVGMYGPAMQNHRSRIGHSVTVSPLLTVSGEGCTFANLYFPYGLANATDLNLLKVTGNRNSFVNCHFLQTDATPLDEAGYKLIDLQAAETYFKNCYFGGDTVAWTNGTMVNFAASVDPPRVVFDNCLFVMNSDHAQVTFLKAVAGLGRCTIVFKGCQFLNLGTSLTYGIDGAGLGNAKMIFDNNSFFAGVDDVVAVANEASVWCAPANTPIAQVTGGASVALFNLIAGHPDVS